MSDFATVTGNSTNDQAHGNPGALGSTSQSSTNQQPFEQPLRQESYTKDTDRSFPLAGGVASKHDPATKHSTEHQTASTTHPTSNQYSTQQTSTQTASIGDREPGTKEREVTAREGHGREGLAGAAAAAAAVGGASALAHSHQKDPQSQGQDTQKATFGDRATATTTTVRTKPRLRR